MKTHYKVIFLLFTLCACNPVRHIPEGHYLLDKVAIQMDDKGVDKTALLPYIQQKNNASKPGLWVYNLVNNDSNFIKKFIRKIGEPPVVFNPNLVPLSVEELSVQMKNWGYLNSSVSARIDTAGKKAEVTYFVHNGEPYRIRNYTIDIHPLRDQWWQLRRKNGPSGSPRPDTTARRRSDRRLIREGAVFNLEMLKKERARVSSQLRNRGYYTFTEENLHYLADTTLRSNQVDLTMALADSLAQQPPYTVRRVNVFSGYDPLEKYTAVDSLEYNGIHLYYDSLHFLRPKVIAGKIQVRPGQLYREREGESTYNLLQALNCMGRVDMRYTTLDADSTLLDCNLYLTPGNSHSLQTGLGGTNKAGDLGVALDITYGNLNIFNGSEIFNIHLRGAYEFVSRKDGNDALTDNYYELGISPSLTFPKLHLPLIEAYMDNHFHSQTQYRFGYNIQKRPEYIRNFFNFNWKFSWSSQRSTLSQSLSLLDVNYVNMPWISDKFRTYLDQKVDSLTKFSYNNMFTAGIAYSLIYTNANTGRLRQNLYTIRFSLESSGNALSWIFDAAYRGKTKPDSYTIFGNPFAQYLKGEIDFAETFRINSVNGLAFHAGVGLAYPYKNSSILPFEKRYYGGGPNHVRGWHTRYLGPGSLNSPTGNPALHVGDINLILSAEYRYRILPWLEPAFFVDAGNIWTIKDYPDQPGGLFRWNTFFREMAVGAGIGLRFDFNFLIFRLDAGTRVYDPVVQDIVFLKGKFFNHSAAYVAIGYPF